MGRALRGSFGALLLCFAASEAGAAPVQPSESEAPSGATLTAWGKHGGRKWSVCNERVIEADRALSAFHDQAQSLAGRHPWGERAEACPHAIPVLELAARKESLRLVALPDGVDEATTWEATEKELAESRGRALKWLEAAEREAQRRGEPTPAGLDYWRARALMALNRIEAARTSLARSDARGHVPAYQRDRLRALLALYDGDLEQADAAAHRAWRDAPIRDGAGRGLPDPALAGVIYALTLDRAGDDEGAARLLRAADQSGERSVLFLQRLETFMPLHERLYFRALWTATLRGSDRKLAIRYFEAYLARPEPAEPERRLAERHIARLRAQPGRLGG